MLLLFKKIFYSFLISIGTVISSQNLFFESGNSKGNINTIGLYANSFWEEATETLQKKNKYKYFEIKNTLELAFELLPKKPKVLELEKGDIKTKGAYGHLPTLYVDKVLGYSFPSPITPPIEFSWVKAIELVNSSLKHLEYFEKNLKNWQNLPLKQKIIYFDKLESLWILTETKYSLASQNIRYLKMWTNQMLDEYNYYKKSNEQHLPSLLALALDKNSSTLGHWEKLRVALKPKRILQPKHLPNSINPRKKEKIIINIVTDIKNKKFIREFEGAIQTHWNYSPWPKENQVQFKIQWKKIKTNKEFLNQMESLNQHLTRFPSNAAGLTTGGLSTFVRKNVLVLGPGKITPRTLAHEFGHLLGFSDCYYRTLSSLNVFGLAILEWNNPIYPHELMCDNNIGVAHSQVW